MRFTPAPADVPPGHAREYERRLRLIDGRGVVIRPVVPADAAELAHAIMAADPAPTPYGGDSSAVLHT